ncbi:2-oxoisovalerate dehydrogenase subunit alpha [Sarcoptes scabiei]|nr:2-oxoisovalerate dehydrogenase subunit alpha [Sarcoptes scabiei]
MLHQTNDRIKMRSNHCHLMSNNFLSENSFMAMMKRNFIDFVSLKYGSKSNRLIHCWWRIFDKSHNEITSKLNQNLSRNSSISVNEIVESCGPGRGGFRRRSPRKLMPLVFKQHVPNVSENTLGASGLSEGPITRTSRRFKELVPNYNRDILFKDEEGTGADRLMTQRLKERLNTLAISVMNQWPGVRLRVTECWDEDGSHATNSLHYEGRAVDITTSDRDRSKYGMLARLAVEAGFDWVYYESRFHIHCSVKSEKSQSARNGGCFDETSIVHGRNGPMSIKDLKIDDEILTVNPGTGRFEYSPVLMFLDRDPQTERLYYEFETENGGRITTTPSHLLFVVTNENDNSTMNADDRNPIQIEGHEEFAKNIEIGQYLFMRSDNPEQQQQQHPKIDRIVRIRTKKAKGVYAPLTMTGTIVINNFVASCYAIVQNQQITHWSFLPARLAYSFIHFGDSLSRSLNVLHRFDSDRSHSSIASNSAIEPLGIHWYPNLLYSVLRNLIPKTILFD